MYHPLRFFAGIGALFGAAATALGVRFMYFYISDGGSGHIQSLVLLAVFVVIAVQCFALGLIGDVLSANRTLLESLRLNELRRRQGSNGRGSTE